MNTRVLLRCAVAITAAFVGIAHAWAQGCGCAMGSCGPGGCVCGCGPGGGLENNNPAAIGASFQSQNITMRSRLTLAEIGGAGQVGSAIWGWRDAASGREFALYGLSNGTAFIEVTNPNAPAYLGMLPTATGATVWRELQTYQNYVYVVSDNNNAHGMQIFDLNRLLTANPLAPVNFTEDAHYSGITNAHTITINTVTGMAMLNGSSQTQHILSLANPLAPVALGNYDGQGYVHDSIAVVYNGPDSRYTGKRINFNSNAGNGINIVDYTNPAAPQRINNPGTSTYPGLGFTHQGWLTDDQKFLIVNDEFDEANAVNDPNMRTKTHIWDMSDLQNPRYIGAYIHDGRAIDHNLFIKGDLVYMSNYSSGLRVFNIRGLYNLPGSGAVSQSQIQNAFQFVGFFDTYNQDDANPETSFNGQWGNYPFFPSGTIIAGDRNNGLFVLTVNAPEPGTFGLVALAGLGGLVVLRRRRG